MGSIKNTSIYITGCIDTINSTLHIGLQYFAVIEPGVQKCHLVITDKQIILPGKYLSYSHLPDRQGIRQSCGKSKVQLAQGKQYLRDACPKGKLEFISVLALYSVT